MSTHLSEDPILEALLTSQRSLALEKGAALRFPAAVAPFAALGDTTPDAVADLKDLLEPGESVYVIASPLPSLEDLRFAGSVPCLQMIFPQQAMLAGRGESLPIEALHCADSADMLALIEVAYPGYFRSQTCQMGRYFGLRDASGRLIAMGGERLVATPWREISALCIHPDYAGQGLGSAILAHLLRLHRQEGSLSWLWVTESNQEALRLYQRTGFQIQGRTILQRLERNPIQAR